MVAAPLLARPLNALLLGEGEAFHLGIDTERTKKQVVTLAALVVGAAVAVSGVIGFIGLVVPHLLRLAVGPDHRVLIPGSALLGGALLLGADVLARTIVAPAELPIGIVTALVGAPFFLWLLLRDRKRGTGYSF
jgi:iron complex transport system permease protein